METEKSKVMDKDLKLEKLKNSMEERQCRTGTPTGPTGIVEKVYQARGRIKGVYKCKVIMEDTGKPKYFDIYEVYVF